MKHVLEYPKQIDICFREKLIYRFLVFLTIIQYLFGVVVDGLIRNETEVDGMVEFVV